MSCSIEPVPRKFFSGGRNIVDDTERSLWSILNELITCVNGSSSAAGKFIRYFDHSDVSAGSLSLGTTGAGVVVSEVGIAVLTPFDGGTMITVGDAGGNARLIEVAHNAPGDAELYKRDADHEYVLPTEVKIYFPGGSPTTGTGFVVVYIS